MSIELQSIKFPRPQVDPLNAREKRIVKGSFAFIALILTISFTTMEGGPVMQWVRHREALTERDRIAAVMNPLADAGKPAAVIWHAQNYPGATLEPLKALADVGNAHAQWALAQILESSNAPEAFRLAKMASDGGYPDAVNYEMQEEAKAKTKGEQS